MMKLSSQNRLKRSDAGRPGKVIISATSKQAKTRMKITIKHLVVVLTFALCAAAFAQPRSITNDLVLHLTFDNTLNDNSGRGNNATYVSSNGLSIQPVSPTYVSGKLGQGFRFNTYSDASLIEYATLGYPADLKFGTATDFTVAFWINTFSTNIANDCAYIANRNWNSSSSVGWGVFAQSGRTTVRVHYFSTSGTSIRPNTPAGENLYDGAWHHLVVTCQRGGTFKVYVDGVLESSGTFAASSNSFDTDTLNVNGIPLAINIGQDGTGTYTQAAGGPNPPATAGTAGLTNAAIDDLGIWRRLLTDLEVASVYNFALNGTNLYDVPDVHTPIVTSFSPPNNGSGVSPYIPVTARIEDQSTAVNTNSLILTVDGVSVPFTLSHNAGTNILTYTATALSAPGSLHTNKLIFADDAAPVANRFTNTAVFSIIQWSNIYLPPPIYFENFDSVSPATNPPANYPTDISGNYPTGWSVSNCTTLLGTWDILSPSSDTYANFQTVPREIIQFNFNYDGRITNIAYPLFVNGVFITSTLASNNIIFAASDQRPNGPQVDYLFTKDYDLTGQTNVFLALWNMFSQENGELGAIEYSINQGATWLPVIYMIDPRSAIVNTGVVDALATMTNIFTRVQPNNCTADPDNTYYGKFIGVASNLWSTLGPYISLRAGSDHNTYHTIEQFRLPQADNQANVRFRFAFTGKDYWDWGFDNFGLYSITPTPLQITSISKVGTSVIVNWNGTGVNSASGLQKSTSINPPNWVTIPGTIGLSTYTDAFSAGGAYYRAVRY